MPPGFQSTPVISNLQSSSLAQELLVALQTIASICGNQQSCQSPVGKPAALIFLKECESRKLKFSGKPNESLSEFFEKIDDIRRIVKISDADLLLCFTELLQEPALTCFKVNRPFFNSYDDLKDAFNEIYKINEFDSQAVAKLCMRTQVKGESIDNFVAVMKDLNVKLDIHWPDATLLDRVLINLHPDYLEFFRGKQIGSFERLLQLGRVYESLHVKQSRYKPPPSSLWRDKRFGLESYLEVKSCAVQTNEFVNQTANQDMGSGMIVDVPYELTYAAALERPPPIKPPYVSQQSKSIIPEPPKSPKIVEKVDTPKRCFRCHSTNHFVKDCQFGRSEASTQTIREKSEIKESPKPSKSLKKVAKKVKKVTIVEPKVESQNKFSVLSEVKECTDNEVKIESSFFRKPITPKNFKKSRPPKSEPDQDLEDEEFCDKVLRKAIRLRDSPYTRYSVRVQLGGINVAALIDCGSTHTLVKSDLVPELTKRSIRYHSYETPVEATLADNSKAPVLGHMSTPINLLHRSVVLDCQVFDSIPLPLVLGQDALKAFKININFGNDRITMPGQDGRYEDVPLIHISSTYISDFIHVASVSTIAPPEELDAQCELTQNQKRHFDQLLDQWGKKLAESPGVTDVFKHSIYLKPGTTPIKQRPYPTSPATEKLIQKEIDDMLEKGHIEESESPWSSPIVLVDKKTGDKRLCIDFRKVNDVTIKNAYPAPSISNILNQLKDSYYISTIDLKSGFWQILLDDASKPITAFSVPGKGLYQFRKMPFGITNAPGSFQQLMDIVLRPVKDKGVFVYIDDIIVIGKDYETHTRNLELVFECLLNAGLAINWKKSNFLKPYVSYLGFMIGQGKIYVSREKVRAILDATPPKTRKGIRSFLGLASWYRRFIPHFSTIAAPLNLLLRKEEKWHWKEEQQLAFDTLKKCLAEPPVLHCPDFDHPFEIHTDASQVGLGGVLVQKINGEERVIAYISRTFSAAERNYSTTERECLSVLHCVEAFRPYVDNTEFLVVTDHSSLLWLKNIKNPTGRLARWAIRLSQFNMRLIHRKGKYMSVPDALSRFPYNDLQEAEVELDENEEEIRPDCVKSAAIDIPRVPDFSNTTDEWYKEMVVKIADQPEAYPTFKVKNGKIFKIFEDKDKVLSRKLLVPSDFRELLMHENHASIYGGHLGFERTLAKIKSRYYWANMYIDVRAYVAKCELCHSFKPSNQRPAGLMRSYVSMLKPGSSYSLDIIGPLPMTRKQNRFLIVFLDMCTKWIVATPVRNATAPAVIKVLEEEIIPQFGTPELILTDNGAQFISKLFQEECLRFGISVHHTPAYYPAGNMVERHNRTLKDALKIFCREDQRTWDVNLKYILFALRTAKSDATGYSPAYLTYLRELRNPFELFKENENGDLNEFDPETYANTKEYDLAVTYKNVLESVKKSRERQAHSYNLRRREVKFKVDDCVFRKNHPQSDKANFETAKLAPKKIGPFKIHRIISPTQYEIATVNGKVVGTAHVSELEPFVNSVNVELKKVRILKREE